jgi:hypothetical protein
MRTKRRPTHSVIKIALRKNDPAVRLVLLRARLIVRSPFARARVVIRDVWGDS